VAERLVVRRTATLLAAVLVTAGLTSCSSTKSYCSALKDDQKQLTRLSKESAKPGKAGTQALDDTVAVLSDLRDDAPDDISGEWDTLVEALEGLVGAIKDSGASPSEFAGGQAPDGVTTGQLKAVQAAATELQSTRVRQAGASIEQHARDVCKVDLGTGGGLGGSLGG
jgi:hypothetical protein